jgi:hypothetical protein
VQDSGTRLLCACTNPHIRLSLLVNLTPFSCAFSGSCPRLVAWKWFVISLVSCAHATIPSVFFAYFMRPLYLSLNSRVRGGARLVHIKYFSYLARLEAVSRSQDCSVCRQDRGGKCRCKWKQLYRGMNIIFNTLACVRVASTVQPRLRSGYHCQTCSCPTCACAAPCQTLRCSCP